MLDRLQRALARSPLAVTAALKLRNQCEMIVGYHLGEDHRRENNGEVELIKLVGPSCHSFIDVGANVGDWSALMLATGDKCGLLIEPSVTAMSCLRGRFLDKAQLGFIQTAASDTPGQLTFYDQGNAGEMSSLVASFTPDGVPQPIEVTTVDIEAAKHGMASVDFLKIDAEGYDLHVLRGAEQLLRTKRIGLIQFEYSVPWADAGGTLAAALTLLEGHGYHVFLLLKSGLHPFRYARYGEFFKCSNFVGVSPGWLGLVQPMIRPPV